MKKIKLNFIFSLLVILSVIGCKKDETEYISGSSFNVINAAIDGGAVKVNPGTSSIFTFKGSADQIAYGTNLFYATFVGVQIVTVVSATDTTKTLFTRSINFHRPMNTLYLSGQAPLVDTLFREEPDVPFIQGSKLNPDSSVYLRFVNLSHNSTPLNIKLTTATGNEVSALAYKGITAFKKYEAKTTTANYVFEVRDVATNTLRLSYTFNPNTNRHKTAALVIRGLMGATTGTNAFAISQVNYY